MGVVITSVKEEWKPVNNYMFYQNYPNPFNPSTKIGYKLKERGYVKLYVYDIKGELVSVLVNEVQEAGYYEVEFNAAVSHSDLSGIGGLASGVYIYQIIYDILGRKVKELVNTKQQAGRYEVQFEAKNLASGVYIYQLITDKYLSLKKMIMLK